MLWSILHLSYCSEALDDQILRKSPHKITGWIRLCFHHLSAGKTMNLQRLFEQVWGLRFGDKVKKRMFCPDSANLIRKRMRGDVRIGNEGATPGDLCRSKDLRTRNKQNVFLAEHADIHASHRSRHVNTGASSSFCDKRLLTFKKIKRIKGKGQLCRSFDCNEFSDKSFFHHWFFRFFQKGIFVALAVRRFPTSPLSLSASSSHFWFDDAYYTGM